MWENNFESIETIERSILSKDLQSDVNNKPNFIRKMLNRLDTYKESRDELISSINQDWWFGNGESARILKNIIIENINHYYSLIEELTNKTINSLLKSDESNIQ